MADYNPYEYPPQQPVQPPYQAPAEKPTSVTVFGVLNCILGGLGLIGIPCVIFGFLWADKYVEMEMTFEYKIYLLFSFIIGTGFTIWQLILGIGLLKFKRWSRHGCVIYGWTDIVRVIIVTLVDALTSYFGWVSMPEADIGTKIGTTCGVFISWVYPILLLIFMKSVKVKQAFGE